ncbi:DUF7669 domain-containing protein [Deinococcus yavapaiensis]|uniref:Uncharacterized protein DUF402 n=1 Tax=Deinococcus yavapaiensis KR-236 TaxID=694435 RepID=A0A318SH89_9DEIO|nr:DUF402 domain-containing protein [Deinococcus yavapaiensis]PYE53298.1 uncharacterized protein DUF402 [Deinococcus yavapaiensis KR-236]
MPTNEPPNWMVLRDAAQKLTHRGLTPFTRSQLIATVHERYPDRGESSLNPMIQGMTVNLKGGAPGGIGKEIFRSVGRGLFELLEPPARSATQEVTPGAITLQAHASGSENGAATIHPVREQRVDVTAKRHHVWNGTAECDEVSLRSSNLYLARRVNRHAVLAYMQSLFLPALGLIVNRFFERDGSPHWQWFVDVAHIQPGDTIWLARDFYLDVVIELDGTLRVEDTDEFIAAVREGHLTAQEAEFALSVTHDLINALQRHGNSMATFLEEHGVAFPDATPLASP